MSGKIPYTADQIDADLRTLIDATGGILATLFHFPDAMRDQFLGVEVGDQDWWDGPYSDGPDEALVSQIPLDRHPMVDVVRQAYAYAYQLDGAPIEVETLWYDVAPVRDHLPSTYINGLPTQMSASAGLPGEKHAGAGRILRVLETFEARYRLNAGLDLTIDDLALLADMSPMTVRTSLSKEGLRLLDPSPEFGEGIIPNSDMANGHPARASRGGPKRSMLGNAEANDWLSRRRGFIPNRQPGTGVDWKVVARSAFSEPVSNFPAVLLRVANLAGISRSDIAAVSKMDTAWAEGLLAGDVVSIDVEALVRLAQALHVEPASFAGQAVAHLLSAQKCDP